jgi:hypothetical protein
MAIKTDDIAIDVVNAFATHLLSAQYKMWLIQLYSSSDDDDYFPLNITVFSDHRCAPSSSLRVHDLFQCTVPRTICTSPTGFSSRGNELVERDSGKSRVLSFYTVDLH